MTERDDPEFLLREAARLRRLGQVPEAIDAYERLLALRPDLAESWYNLGLLRRHAGAFDAALDAYQRALDLRIRDPEEVHLNRAVIYSDHLNDPASAERELNAALARNPEYIPAIFNLANLREDQGQREDALALYEAILARRPDEHEALARAANLRTISGADDPLAHRLREGIARPGVPAAERASLGFVLGKLLDASGAYDEAFSTYTAANQASRDAAGGAAYDRAAQEAFISRIIDAFPVTAEPTASAQPAPAIFICGMFRSGSSLAEQVLACHPRVTPAGEIGALSAVVRENFLPYPERAGNAAPAEVATAAAQYRQALARRFPAADVITDKRPDNFLMIGAIKRMFPDAKIIHTVRNALDNCLSVFFLHLDQRMSYALDLDDIAHYYGQYRRLMAHWKTLYPRDILDFDYDAFVHDARVGAERLLRFCGLQWDDACLSPHLAAGAVKTASVWQVREPLYTRSSGRSAHYARHMSSLRKSLGEFAT